MPNESSKLLREVRILRAHVVISTTFLLLVSIMAFRRATEPTRFDEIDVERINIREPDGKLRLVLSNRPRSPGGIAHGKQLGGDGARPGMIFYNDEGTENGGLVFEGKADSGGHAAGAQLSLDQYDQDQVLTLVYDDQAGRRTTGLNVFDRPDVPMVPWFAARDSIDRLPDGPAKTAARQRLFAQLRGKPMTARRVFVGRDSTSSAVVRLSDAFGRTRLRLVVDSLGNAHIEFLDGRGQVSQRIPSIQTDSTRRPD